MKLNMRIDLNMIGQLGDVSKVSTLLQYNFMNNPPKKPLKVAFYSQIVLNDVLRSRPCIHFCTTVTHLSSVLQYR